MVAKINVGSSLYGLLAYNQKKIDEEEGRVLLTNRMFESEDGNFNIYRCMESFQMQLPQDIRTEKPIIHISLNPHPDDKLSDEQLALIAEEYMDKLGYGKQPYIVYKHEDIDRHHIHIISLRVDEYGKKLNDKFEFRRSKDITRELERKYGLHPAEKLNYPKQAHLKKVNYQAGNVKKQISNTVKGVMQNYRFQSLGEYKAVLSLYNIHAEEVKGEVRGRKYHGIVYSATNNDGEKKGNPIKSSLIGKSVGVVTVERKMKQTAELWKKGDLRAQIKNTIQKVLENSTSMDHFKDDLKKRGIDLILRKNDAGRIYGVTFIDHQNRIALNGSRLGKAFSANAISQLSQGEGIKNVDATASMQAEHKMEDTSEYHSDFPSRGFLIGDILKMIFNKSGNQDDDYHNQSGKRKRKKKRRYGRQI